MTLRQKIISDLTTRVGFAFTESELSPSVRKNIGDLEPTYRGLDTKTTEYSVLEHTANTFREVAIALILVGGFFAILGILMWPMAIIGFILLGSAYLSILIGRKRGSEPAQIKESEISSLVSTARTRLDTLGKTIYDELSSVYANRTGPRNHAMLKETTIVKELVMIPCKYCKGLMPQTSTFCPTCGAQRKG